LALNPKRAIALWIGFLLADFALNLFANEIQKIFDYKQIIGICNVLIKLIFTFYLLCHIHKQRYNLGEILKLRLVKHSVISSVLFFCVGFSYIAIFLRNLLNFYIGVPTKITLIDYSDFSDIIIIIGIIIIFPVWEELSCRGLLSSSLESRYGKWTGILITSLAFGFMHYYPINIFFTFFIGIGLGWIASETNSLFPSLLIHIIFNMSILSKKVSLFGENIFIRHNLITIESLIIIVAVILLVISINQLLANRNKVMES
jgi:membrane protease YdiL (CAAX protease family)